MTDVETRTSDLPRPIKPPFRTETIEPRGDEVIKQCSGGERGANEPKEIL